MLLKVLKQDSVQLNNKLEVNRRWILYLLDAFDWFREAVSLVRTLTLHFSLGCLNDSHNASKQHDIYWWAARKIISQVRNPKCCRRCDFTCNDIFALVSILNEHSARRHTIKKYACILTDGNSNTIAAVELDSHIVRHLSSRIVHYVSAFQLNVHNKHFR